MRSFAEKEQGGDAKGAEEMTRYSARLIQGGIMVAAVSAPSKEEAEREILHYAAMYSQDGQIKIRRSYPLTAAAMNNPNGRTGKPGSK